MFIEQVCELIGHGSAKLLDVIDGDGAAIPACHIMADADGEELHVRAVFDLGNGFSQMAFQIT